jgi:hypothetical protein
VNAQCILTYLTKRGNLHPESTWATAWWIGSCEQCSPRRHLQIVDQGERGLRQRILEHSTTSSTWIISIMWPPLRHHIDTLENFDYEYYHVWCPTVTSNWNFGNFVSWYLSHPRLPTRRLLNLSSPIPWPPESIISSTSKNRAKMSEGSPLLTWSRLGYFVSSYLRRPRLPTRHLLNLSSASLWPPESIINSTSKNPSKMWEGSPLLTWSVGKLGQLIPQPPKTINSSPFELKLTYPMATIVHHKLNFEKSDGNVRRVPSSHFFSWQTSWAHTSASQDYQLVASRT